ncbi:MAG: TolC family protein [Candidatus Omnitrophica bacterium]|nr:TolC family protein [Candidatus Omnitrophota bacterium]
MKIVKGFLSLALVVLTPASFAMAQNAPLTLKDCYRLALARSESIGIQKELIKETEGLMLQSLSTALPKVAFAYTQTWQDLKPNNTFGGYQPGARFTFSQPLFTGFKEFAAIRASKHLGKQRDAELKRAEQLLFTDVSDSFYLYLSYQEDLKVQEDIQKILIDRVTELKKREVLGKSRTSEVASAQAKLLVTEAGIEASRGQKDVAGQLLDFIIGQPVGELAVETLPDGTQDLQVLEQKVDERLDVVAARESLGAFKENIVAARSLFFPSVLLTGDSYTKRTDANEGNNWDVMLSVNVPIFNGLNDVGQVRQARAQANEADLKLSLARRNAVLEIRNAFTKLEAARRNAVALSKAVLASDKNYHLQVDDFQKNLVNNLDVLQALEDLQSVRRSEVAADTDVNRAFWDLKVATGEELK